MPTIDGGETAAPHAFISSLLRIFGLAHLYLYWTWRTRRRHLARDAQDVRAIAVSSGLSRHSPLYPNITSISAASSSGTTFHNAAGSTSLKNTRIFFNLAPLAVKNSRL